MLYFKKYNKTVYVFYKQNLILQLTIVDENSIINHKLYNILTYKNSNIKIIYD